MTEGRWRRRLERAGTWWAEARDGSWSRWDARHADWMVDPAGPPGPIPPLAGEPAPPAESSAEASAASAGARMFLRALEIYLPILGLSALALLVLGLLLVPLVGVFNAVTGIWLGIELDAGPLLAVLGVILAGCGFFLALGLAVAERPGVRSKLAAAAITLAGLATVFTALGLVTGVDSWGALIGPGIGTSLVLALVGTVFELYFSPD